jgi:chromosome partitioning protein
VRTMFDPRSSLTNEVSSQLNRFFGAALYAAVIPRNVRLAEAPSFGEPILKYDPVSRGAAAYRELATEMLSRHSAGDGRQTVDRERASL